MRPKLTRPKTFYWDETNTVKDFQKTGHKNLEAEIKTFCELHNSLETRAFFEEMEKAALLRLDWPEHFGGRGWNRREQLMVIKALAKYECPIFPEALSLGAPLIINLSVEEDKLFLLENLVRNISAWRIHHNPENEGFFWNREDSSLYVIYQKKKFRLGESGLAEEYLSKYFSTACLLQQWLSGILLSKNLSQAIKGFIEDEIIEEEISFRAVERLFRESESRSLQALKSNSGKTKVHQILTRLMGYEGLLKKTAEAGSNDPPKFLKERVFLESVESQFSLNEILIKDQVYEESLDNDEK